MIKTIALPLTVAVAAIGIALASSPAVADRAVPIPAPAGDVVPTAQPRVAVFAGGCFWGMQAIFERVKGVTGVTAGYAGGSAATATYDQVSTEGTGHAEAIRITYDPRVVSYGTLLRVYFSVATDPTSLDREGPDSGPSYRTAIFPQNAAQRGVAAAYIAQLTRAKAFRRPIVTKLESGRFFPAESYHQYFYDKNPNHPYIVTWDKPKVAAFRAVFPQLAK
ncbi:peptide-methionine (S)-S-oxide reductase MsrA [Sphingomonas sp.]|jgi:peptide-methionine (S)-S-oxide reductase|uniref:peptide-methionine (S)-S-oxide reductase MsrA n=1 Tax=Sphingomonas sp. TaxID=28214 RepID=UPI002E35BA9A|nr:peptide-methionine (S)-S-oxide reductase MsrA [Sphingomonas sp.]HEX4695058.1 peptide-methionine (S)-S-oxide reductase MsrA [Sphingomonas sp.]